MLQLQSHQTYFSSQNLRILKYVNTFVTDYKYAKIEIVFEQKYLEDLFPYASLNYEVLHGDKAGLESVRVNNQYRIEFRSEIINKEQSITICNILELSNHYK
jgi:proteic killer suppression protein